MNRGCPDFQATWSMSRRSLLRVGSAGLAGLTLPALLRASEDGRTRTATARSVIFLHQFGGPSHIDTFDMKPDAPQGIRGEFDPIPSSVPGITVCEHLPRFAKVIDKVAQVRSVHHRMKNHNSAGYYSLTGHAPPLDDQRLRDSLELYPAYGSTVAKLKPVEDPAIPTFVSFPHVIRDGSVNGLWSGARDDGRFEVVPIACAGAVCARCFGGAGADAAQAVARSGSAAAATDARLAR